MKKVVVFDRVGKYSVICFGWRCMAGILNIFMVLEEAILALSPKEIAELRGFNKVSMKILSVEFLWILYFPSGVPWVYMVCAGPVWWQSNGSEELLLMVLG